MAPQTLPATVETASTQLSTVAFLTNLPARLDDHMLAQVEAIANAPLPALPTCSSEHMAKCLKTLAILPRQAIDAAKGELAVRLYERKLGHLPAAAMSYLADQALERCEWYPTIAECLKIAGEWQRSDEPVQAKARAQALARRERETRMDEAMTALQRGELDDEAVNAWPEWWKQIAQTRGLVTITDGVCRIRASAIWRPDVATTPAEALAGAAEQFPSNR